MDMLLMDVTSTVLHFAVLSVFSDLSKNTRLPVYTVPTVSNRVQ